MLDTNDGIYKWLKYPEREKNQKSTARLKVSSIFQDSLGKGFQGATTTEVTWVVSGSACRTGSDKGQLSHEDTDGTSNVYSDFYMQVHHHSQYNLTNHMRRQHMPAYILQGF